MDFFAQQEESRRQSHKIIWRFILANFLIASILTIAVQAVYIIGISGGATPQTRTKEHSTILESTLNQLLDWHAFALINVVVFLIIGTAAFIKFRTLAANGGAVAQMLGGQKITHDTRHPLEKRLLNIVDEMAIASGLPVPEVYVLQGQEGINAFASGPTPEQSAVTVTRGALERLNRDELQGVIAHEFSHILHGDVRLNIRLAAYIFGLIVLISIGKIFLELSRGRSYSNSNRKSFAPLLMLGVVVMVLGSLGRLLSVLMSAAISRNREYLADATAVQLTRNPTGIASALKKIGGYQYGSIIDSPQAEGMAHFFLADARTLGFFERWSSTHPPLFERIKKLDPHFNGALPESIPLQSAEDEPGISMLHQGEVSSGTSVTPTPRDSGHMISAASKDAMAASWVPPLAITQRLHQIGQPEILIYASLFSHEPSIRSKQMLLLKEHHAASDVQREIDILTKLDINQRLSLMLLAIPLIQNSSRERLHTVSSMVRRLADADNHTSLYELLSIIILHFSLQVNGVGLSLHGGNSSESIRRYQSPIQIITSIFSVCGGDAIEDQDHAFAHAVDTLGIHLTRLEVSHLSIDRIVWAFDQLRNSSPNVRKSLMDVLFTMAHSNEIISPHEQAFMRLAAMLLRMPLPDALVEH